MTPWLVVAPTRPVPVSRAPASTFTGPPRMPSTCSVPARMAVFPVNAALLPDSVSVPAPSLLKLDAPEKAVPMTTS